MCRWRGAPRGYSIQAKQSVLVDNDPAGTDELLLVGLTGTEAISELSRIQLQPIATKETEVHFERGAHLRLAWALSTAQQGPGSESPAER